MQRTHAQTPEGARASHLVRDVLAILVVGLLVWALCLELQVIRLNAQVAKLSGPIVVTGYPDRQFTTVNDLALALLRVHDREKGLEDAIEQDIHNGGSSMLHTHQYIDNKWWAADASK